MNKLLVLGVLFLLFCSTAFAITAVKGKVEKIDHTAKTIVVKAEDGTEHTFHFVGRTAVHGTEMAGAAAKESFHGLKEGSDVVVHYTAKGSEETAEEIDHVGEGGLKTAEGTVTHLDRGAKTVTIKTADGTEQAFRLTDHAAEDAGKDVSEGAEKSGKVTVYYTEQPVTRSRTSSARLSSRKNSANLGGFDTDLRAAPRRPPRLPQFIRSGHASG